MSQRKDGLNGLEKFFLLLLLLTDPPHQPPAHPPPSRFCASCSSSSSPACGVTVILVWSLKMIYLRSYPSPSSCRLLLLVCLCVCGGGGGELLYCQNREFDVPGLVLPHAKPAPTDRRYLASRLTHVSACW